MSEAKRVTVYEMRTYCARILNDIYDNGAEYVVWSGGGRRHRIYPIARMVPCKPEDSGFLDSDAVEPEH